MISNEKQYHRTKKYLKEAQEVLLEYQKKTKEGEYIKLLEMKGVESRIRKFQSEIDEYENLRSGKLTTVQMTSFDEIPRILIKSRIAKNWTQADLAAKIGVQEQQIQLYESAEYAGASFRRIQLLLDALGISMPPVNIQVNTPKFDTGEDEGFIAEQQHELMIGMCLIAIN